jgi:hypothetical protein
MYQSDQRIKERLAICLEFGFHDIKKYIHSGLASELAKEFDIVWLVLNKHNELLHEYLVNTGYDIEYIDSTEILEINSRIEAYNQSIRRNWMVNKNLGLFHNYQIVRTKSLKTQLIGNSFLKHVFESLTLAHNRNYLNRYLIELFKRKKFTKILFSGYSSTFIKNIMASAGHMSIETYCIVNSWKDLFVNNFIPRKSLTKLFVWDETMKADYLKHMPYLKTESLFNVGNPTFDYLIGSAPKFERVHYSQKYHLPIESKWIYYTMMPPGIVNNEIETIIFIAEQLCRQFGKEYMILIRKNPNHHRNEFMELKLPQNARLTQHYCEFDLEKDMLIQVAEGEQEWLDLLHYTIANFSVPSTVTKECMILGKLVFNIAFDKDNQIDQRLKQFFDAGFYRSIFDEKSVFYIKNIESLILSLQNQVLDRQNEKLRNIRSVPLISNAIKVVN